jgi:hypothetical protein
VLRGFAIIVIILLIAVVGSMYACGLFWTTAYKAASPDGKATVIVQVRSNFSDQSIRVLLERGSDSQLLIRGYDCLLNFAHAAWSGTRVAVFIDGVYCHTLHAAYDMATNRSVDSRTVEPWLAADIIKSYAVTPDELKENGGNVFKWATYPGDGNPHRAGAEWRKRYPH